MVIERLFGQSPFKLLHEHTKKVHDCVKLMRPLTDALIAGDYDAIETLYKEMSKTEHEADKLKDQVRNQVKESYILSVGKYELTRFIGVQDGVADSAEDYAVILTMRNTKVPKELKEDFLAFVDQVIKVSEHLLNVAEEISLLVESAFRGKEAEKVLKSIEQICAEEWQADKLQRKFAKHCYALEEQLDPVTLSFFDKYCRALSSVANNAEKTSKYLRLLILK